MNVIGLPLDRAKELMTEAGIAFCVDETRCKKGVEGGNDARVIRQTLLEDGRISAALCGVSHGTRGRGTVDSTGKPKLKISEIIC